MLLIWYFFFFQAEDGIRDLVRSRGLGDVYKRQSRGRPVLARGWDASTWPEGRGPSAAELDRAGYGLSLIHI